LTRQELDYWPQMLSVFFSTVNGLAFFSFYRHLLIVQISFASGP